MKLRTWIYFFKNASLNILNNRLIHLISMGTITISMLLFGSFMLLSFNLNNWIKEWGESLSMSVYLKDNIQEKTKEAIEKALMDLKGAEIKGFISKEQAMINLKEGLGDQAGLLSGLKSNTLPSSFEILFKDVNASQIDPQKIKRVLEKMEGVDEVQYSEQWVERFEGVMYLFKVVAFTIGGLLCMAVLFITTNTIKLTIYSRRDEIEIYKLVGATDWFVKIPFLIEGAIQGIISGLVAFLILFLIYSVFSLKTVHLFGLPAIGISFLPNEHSLFIILLSLILGFLGGLIAIGRFFRT
ncbi:MAG: ABC transporter permease [Deltaproteobacteria bacterium]|nr:ABC transporter permease [Deltaproteobacteria bacterium]